MVVPQELAEETVNTVLTDQIARGESLHSGAGILGGLAGVITTLAGMSSTLPHRFLGQVGLIAAGTSAVLAVSVLLVPRPGRQPRDLPGFVNEILAGTGGVAERFVLTVGMVAAAKNDRQLRWKGLLIVVSAVALTVAVSALVGGSIEYKGTAT